MDMRIFTVVSQNAECIKLVLLPVCPLSHHTLRTLSFSNDSSRSLGKPNYFSMAIHPVTFSDRIKSAPFATKTQSRKTKLLSSLGS